MANANTRRCTGSDDDKDRKFAEDLDGMINSSSIKRQRTDDGNKDCADSKACVFGDGDSSAPDKKDVVDDCADDNVCTKACVSGDDENSAPDKKEVVDDRADASACTKACVSGDGDIHASGEEKSVYLSI